MVVVGVAVAVAVAVGVWVGVAVVVAVAVGTAVAVAVAVGVGVVVVVAVAITGALFDPAPFTNGTPRKPKAKKKGAPDPIVGELFGSWRVIRKQATAHWVKHFVEGPATKGGGTALTLCNRSGAALTTSPGTVVALCPTCIEKGAPKR